MAQKNGKVAPDKDQVIYIRAKGDDLVCVDMPDETKDAFALSAKALALVVLAELEKSGCDEETGIRFADKACEIAKKAILEGVAEYFKETEKNAKD